MEHKFHWHHGFLDLWRAGNSQIGSAALLEGNARTCVTKTYALKRTGGLIMRKLLLSAAAIAALFTGPALSADLRRPVTKAPPAPVAVYNWTGCYVKGGGGYGMFNQDTTTFDGSRQVGSEVTTGGRGW